MNKNTQHTPAPWIVEYSHGVSMYKYELEYCLVSDSPFTEEQRIANAKLIARAPELLKENEQLKRYEGLYNKSRIEYKDIQQANYKLIDLNAELLEALKELFTATENTVRLLHPEIEIKVESAIAKAQPK